MITDRERAEVDMREDYATAMSDLAEAESEIAGLLAKLARNERLLGEYMDALKEAKIMLADAEIW